MEQQLVSITVEVRSGTARFRVGVQARSIRESLSMVGGRYPRGVVGVAEPKGFFVRRQETSTDHDHPDSEQGEHTKRR